MKPVQFILLSLLLSGAALAQKTPKFTAEISTDSILFGNYFQLSFTLENAKGKNFQPPTFGGFQIVSGPNVSSSISIINGEVSQTATYTFYLQPDEVGNYYIEPASIQTEENVLETKPIQIFVVPNPDSIIQKPPAKDKFHFDLRMPELDTAPQKPEETKPQSKKRKIYKI